MARDYKKEYKEYHSKPEQVANRSQRNKARRKVEETKGNLPSTVDVNHKTPIARGGGNKASNLEVTSQKENRGWRKGKKGYTP